MKGKKNLIFKMSFLKSSITYSPNKPSIIFGKYCTLRFPKACLKIQVITCLVDIIEQSYIKYETTESNLYFDCTVHNFLEYIIMCLIMYIEYLGHQTFTLNQYLHRFQTINKLFIS